VSGTTKVHFDGFAGLPAQRDEFVRSEIFTCLGNNWILQINPGGHADAEEGMVSVFLWNMSKKSITIEYGFSVEDCFDSEMSSNTFAPMDEKLVWGFRNLAKCSKVMESLVDGALVL